MIENSGVRVDSKITDEDEMTPLNVACHNGHLDVVEYLVEKRSAAVDFQQVMNG